MTRTRKLSTKLHMAARIIAAMERDINSSERGTNFIDWWNENLGEKEEHDDPEAELKQAVEVLITKDDAGLDDDMFDWVTHE